MIPTNAVAEQSAKLLAADTTTLAPAVDANVIALIMSNFTPSPTLLIGDVVLATFAGATPILGVTGTQAEGIDPQTGSFVIDLSPAAGGYRWETTATTNLPQTIYGIALLKNDLSVLYASALLPTPILLTGVNQRIDIGDLAKLVFTPNSIQ